MSDQKDIGIRYNGREYFVLIYGREMDVAVARAVGEEIIATANRASEMAAAHPISEVSEVTQNDQDSGVNQDG